MKKEKNAVELSKKEGFYIRVSTVDQLGDDCSIDEQLQIIEDSCKKGL